MFTLQLTPAVVKSAPVLAFMSTAAFAITSEDIATEDREFTLWLDAGNADRMAKESEAAALVESYVRL